MPKTVLVTGANGFLGQCMVTVLLDAGYHVRAQYRKNLPIDDRAEWFQLDFNTVKNFSKLLSGCDAVLNFAAELNEQSAMESVNAIMPALLCAAAEKAGIVYFAHASSVVVYGSPKKRRVDEGTLLLDPHADIGKQYYADPHMREYARTKTLGEIAIAELRPNMVVDILRPSIIADEDRFLEARSWGTARRIMSLYRRTQYIAAADAASAILHLLKIGLSGQRSPSIEAYNLSDESSATYLDLYKQAASMDVDPIWRKRFNIPLLLDMGKDFARFKRLQIRYPLGAMYVSNKKLRDTGFEFDASFNEHLRKVLLKLAAMQTDNKKGGTVKRN
ncbi:MAG: NAD(P)-dependent oxidoreductase [Pseudomonadota bacterium]